MRSPDEFAYDVQAGPGVVVLRLVGELDLQVADHVTTAVEELLDEGFPEVVFDLRELTFLDSSGVHMLMQARRSAARRERAVSLIRGPRNVQRVLELTGIDEIFTFVAADGNGDG